MRLQKNSPETVNKAFAFSRFHAMEMFKAKLPELRKTAKMGGRERGREGVNPLQFFSKFNSL